VRVLFLCHYYSPHVGGVEKHVAEISRILSSRHKITIVTEQQEDNLPLVETISGGIQLVRIPQADCRSMSSRWRWWGQHLNLLLTADVVHIHDVFFWLLPWRLIFWWKKWFITFHGYEGSQAPNWKQRLWHQLAGRLTNGSLAIGAWHERWYGMRTTAISYGAVVADQPNKTAAEPRAVYIGRLSADTGIMTYLEALAWLQKIHRFRLSLDVYGDGPDREMCEKYAKQHQLPVNWHGWQPLASRELSTALIAFVSRYLAILESLAAGVPVIAHYNNNIKRDYLRLTPFSPWISIGHSAQEIGLAILRAEKLPSEAQSWARQQSWNKLSKVYEALWRL
jgi:glycosyltransferase involved in cell wall biosynthesis